jgi:hypothetical protein
MRIESRETFMSVRHEPENARFVADADPQAVLTYVRTAAGTLDFNHTFVPPALRGRGTAAELAAYALSYARDNGLKVVPSCPFVAKFIQRNPQYGDLVAAGAPRDSA